MTVSDNTRKLTNGGFWARLKKDFKRNYVLYLMVLPVVAYYITFCYIPMHGVIIAFLDYDPGWGILKSDWVGLSNFKDFFQSMYFPRLLRNTLSISISTLVFGFPAPIIFALLINEVKNKHFSKTIKTATYLPHFISLVVICGMIKDFTGANGIVTQLFAKFGGESKAMLSNEKLFLPVYVVSEIWQKVGWDSIIYIAALTGINQELYEACSIDGGNRWKQTLHVTIPGIMPTVIIMLILRMGGILGVGHEKIILLYNESIYSTADVISSYVFRRGLIDANYSFATAVGLFNSVVNIIFLIAANTISRKVTENSLW
ncbi:MAG: sugar ABC transporter permease [Ruminococcaceae bacterium]|nr:sugar ABC transporter permease [Oscillospiraceae bacterium]